jgi:hypothetical protein
MTLFTSYVCVTMYRTMMTIDPAPFTLKQQQHITAVRLSFPLSEISLPLWFSTAGLTLRPSPCKIWRQFVAGVVYIRVYHSEAGFRSKIFGVQDWEYCGESKEWRVQRCRYVLTYTSLFQGCASKARNAKNEILTSQTTNRVRSEWFWYLRTRSTASVI